MSYTEDTQYAAENLIALTMHEEVELNKLKENLSEQMAKFKLNKWDFETSDMNDDFSDAHVMHAFAQMAEAKNVADKLNLQVAELQASIGAKQVAVQAMCGALLQLAKQGISLVHRQLNTAPTGRLVSGIPLRDIVWQARNQALHHEEGNFRQPVMNLFGLLEQNFGNEFNLANHVGQSRANQVVQMLGWTEYAAYRDDMRLLGL